jgi:hypothetical protein
VVSQETPLPPKPVPDADTQAHWDGVAERRLLVQRCRACEMWIWQPKPICPRCHTADPEWTQVSGSGAVVSWTIVHPPVLPVWSDDVPFVVLLVELADAPGVRMVGRLVDDSGKSVGSAAGVDFGSRAQLQWRTDEAGQILPAWSLAP